MAMDSNIQRYLAEIGRRGGRKSRRSLDPETARAMVRVREARRAYREFHAQCFWSYRRDLEIGPTDVDWVAETLKKNGNMRAWRMAGRLCGAGDPTAWLNWADDSAWRFMPLVRDEMGGQVLHEVDLAINKVLTLAGRDEARDFADILHAHEHVLPLGALVWAAVGKDPAFTPASLLEQLKRRGRYQPEEIARLALARPFDLVEARTVWQAALTDADQFIREGPHEEVGCLYYAPRRGHFAAPSPGLSLEEQGLVPHFGQPGGILPRVADGPA